MSNGNGNGNNAPPQYGFTGGNSSIPPMNMFYPVGLESSSSANQQISSGFGSAPRSARTSFGNGGPLGEIELDELFDDYFYDDFNPAAMNSGQSDFRHTQGGYDMGDQQEMMYGGGGGQRGMQVSSSGTQGPRWTPLMQSRALSLFTLVAVLLTLSLFTVRIPSHHHITVPHRPRSRPRPLR